MGCQGGQLEQVVCATRAKGWHGCDARAPHATRGNSNVSRNTRPPLQRRSQTKVPQEQVCYGMETLQGISGALKKKY